MKGARILIVEDQALVGRDFQTTLVRQGYSVPAVVSTGEEALRQVENTSPDLILMNIHLEGEWDGIETAARIQIKSNVPILFLTGASDDLSMNRARATYPYGYLVKPISEADLISAVESALRRAERDRTHRQNSQAILETLRSLSHGVIAADLAGNVAYMNRRAEEITEWKAEDAVGQPVRDILQIQGGDSSGRGQQVLLRRKGGKQIAIQDTSAPIETDDGGLGGVVTVFEEVRSGSSSSAPTSTEGCSALESIARSIADPLFTLDQGLKITYLNPEAAEYYESPRDQIIGGEFLRQIPENLHETFQLKFSQALSGQKTDDFDFYLDSRELWFRARLYPYAGGLLVILRNVTELKEQEIENRRLDRLEGLGLLARGFAHDFNNLLTVLLGSLSFAKECPIEDQDLNKQLNQATDATLKAQNLVQQLMTFAQGGRPIKTSVQPSTLVQKLIMERKEEAPDIKVKFKDEASDVTLLADPKQLRRLLENLIRNAEQALGSKGKIRIHASTKPATNGAGQESYIVEISDSGTGMSEDVLSQAMEPFFSTRQNANASGLGLTVCESIARAHGGSISLQSEPDKGTSVTVHLPVASDKESLLLSAQALVPNNNGAKSMTKDGNARILVLEDDAMIRRLIVSTLSKSGHQVDETGEGGATIDAFKKASDGGEPYDLLIMDLTIEEGMGGIEAIKLIKEIDPNVRAIVSSGYNDDPAMANPAAYGFCGVLPKPYDPQHLIEVVNGAIG